MNTMPSIAKRHLFSHSAGRPPRITITGTSRHEAIAKRNATIGSGPNSGTAARVNR
ncbi:MAG: hypothetical protein R3E68_02150 [Burkholderiaceae bacterium]